LRRASFFTTREQREGIQFSTVDSKKEEKKQQVHAVKREITDSPNTTRPRTKPTRKNQQENRASPLFRAFAFPAVWRTNKRPIFPSTDSEQAR